MSGRNEESTGVADVNAGARAGRNVTWAQLGRLRQEGKRVLLRLERDRQRDAGLIALGDLGDLGSGVFRCQLGIRLIDIRLAEAVQGNVRTTFSQRVRGGGVERDGGTAVG